MAAGSWWLPVLMGACGLADPRPHAVASPVTSRAAMLPRCDAGPRPAAVATAVPFGLFSAAPTEFHALRAAGFTMVGPWYVPPPDRALLDAAHTEGLGVVYPLGYPHESWQRAHTIAWDEAQTRAEVGAMVDAVVDHPAIVAWYLGPEELRYWEPAEMAYLRVAAATIHARDPQRRPVLSYQANDRDAQQLAPVVRWLDIAAKGTYVNYAGHREARAWVEWSVEQLADASAHGQRQWLLPEMFEDPAGATDDDIAAWVRHDVLAGLVAGADGVLVYSGWRRPGFTRYDAYLDAYRGVATALGEHGLGAALLHARRCSSRQLRIVDGPSEVQFVAAGRAQTRASVHHVELVDADGHWDVLVNGTADTITVELTPPPGGAWVYGEAIIDGARLRLSPWAVAATHEP
ncbi:MAG: hypothetical protein IPH07_13955 [Deltaproteobacteria bacterium]|nr:hypothetical protein [Deltaproteobacteria bacterium]MBK8716813.1 hypothetical protein [Deltaproteobacteria bacterium]MBP7286920.1 hypothetical protein [Nannocystaceae bacterium]